MPGKAPSRRGKAFKGKVSVVIPVEPGGSVQGPLAALKALPKAEKALICEVLVAEGRNPSRQRNLAVAQAKGEYLQFLDSDSRLQPGALPLLLDAAKGSKVAAVGGPNVAADDESQLGRAFDRVLGSWLGSASSSARYRAIGERRDCGEKELILCNLLFKRNAYLALGGLREDLYPNEENELFNRAQGLGWRLVYEPLAQVQRHRRQTLSAFAYQAFRYGRGRMQQMRASFHPGDLVNLAPLALLFALGGLLSLFDGAGSGLLGDLQILSMALWICFLAAAEFNAYASASVGGLSLQARGHVFIGYPVRHLSYALGLLAGLFQGPAPRPLDVKIRKVRW